MKNIANALWWRLGAIFILALVYRGVYFLEIRQAPLFRYPVIDAEQHHAWATRISAGNIIGRGPDDVFKPYLYPLWVGGMYSLFGPNITVIQGFQLFLGAVSASLTALVGNMFFGKHVGMIAGVLYALYAPSLFFEGQLLTPALSIVLNLVITILLFRPFLSWILIGILGGLAAGIRPDVLAPLLLVCGYRLWQTTKNEHPQAYLKKVAFLAAGFLTIALPLLFRNYTLTGQWIWFSSNAGINFYTGNGPDADGVSAIPPGLAWEQAISTVPKELMPYPASTSQLWFSRGLQAIANNPAAWLKLLFKKGFAFFNGLEFRNNIGYNWFRAGVVALNFPFLQYWPVSALSILGLGFCVVQYRKYPDTILLVLWIAGYFSAGVLFFVTDRFRLPAVPFMIVLVAWVMHHIFETGIRRCQIKNIAGSAMLLAAALVVTWPGWFDAAKGVNHQDYINLGNVLRINGNPREAINAYTMAQKMHPQDPEGWFLTGTTYLNLGEPEQARVDLEKARELCPAGADILLNLGNAFLLTGNRDQAQRQYEMLIELHNTVNLFHKRASVAKAYLGLWQIDRAQNTMDIAQQHLEQAWKVEEQVAAEFCLMNGFALTRSIQLFERLAQEEPWNWYHRANLGIAYFKNGQFEHAVEELERSTALRGVLPGVKFYLGLALLRTGKRTEGYHVLKTLEAQLPPSALRTEIQHVLTTND